MRQLFLVKIIALFIVLMASTSVIAGTHFIVLIDDNHVFKRDYIDKISKTLPEVLFDGIQKKQSVGTVIPSYRPNIDHLSVAFFGLTKSPKRCMKSDPLSIKPEHLFHWKPVPTALHKEKFRKLLNRSLGDECRFKSFASPIFTAESLILPFVQTKLSRDLFFSRTVLLLLSNDAYDEHLTLAQELNDLGKEVENIPNTMEEADLVAKKFHLDRPVNGIFTVANGDTDTFLAGGRKDNQETLTKESPLVYRMTEFRPKILGLEKKLKKLSDDRQKINLDRLAVSNQELHIVPVGGDDATILRLPTFPDLEPIDVFLQFADNQENIWALGKHEFPQYKLLMLDDCAVCKQVKGIPLFKVIMPKLSITPDDEPLKHGTLHFTIRFRYDTSGVYDHAFYDTQWYKVDILPNPPLTIAANWFFPAIVLDNLTLAKQWMTSDTKGLNQEEAKKRIEADRDFLWWAIVIPSIMFFVALGLGLWLYVRYSKYPFKPVLQWTPANEIKLNFNQLTDKCLPIGTLTLYNEGTVPWLVYLFKEPTQPIPFAKLSLLYNALEEYGLRLDDTTTPLGFEQLEESKDGNTIRLELVGETEQMVSHETSIDLFLAIKAITDFEPANEITSSEPIPLPMKASVTMEWEDKKLSKEVSTEIAFHIQLVPKKAAPPQVSYHQRADKENCYFDLGQEVLVGTLRFESCARHHCAVQFQGNFTVQVYRDNFPISSKSIVIEGGEQVAISPHHTENKAVNKAVYIFCDDKLIPNPSFSGNLDSSIQQYAFRVDGKFAPTSELGSCRFELLRDPTQIEIELDIIQFSHIHRIFWEADELPRIQGEISEEPLEGGILELTPYHNLRFDENMPPTPLFDIKIGNTGKAGRGFVRVTIKTLELECDLKAERVKFRESFDDADLCQLFNKMNDTFIIKPIEIKDGDDPTTCVVKLNTTIIDDIVGSRIDKEKATVVVELDIEIVDDVGNPTRRHLILRNPIGLEKLPHPNWLCIDFGTSAITAAIGKENDIRLLSLQKIISDENPHINLADYDPHNEERNLNLLPSYVACDADLRQKESPDPSVKPGFPSYGVGTELPSPGDAHFLGLPAGRAKRKESPKRIIFSLKSWLSQLSLHEIVLPEAVKYQLNQRTVIRKELPLEDTVKSGFAALAEAYLLPSPDFQIGRAVICHPNTFSYWHKKRLHKVAAGALSKRLNIDLPNERIHLISESEAVAYYYCRQRIEQATDSLPLPESEHLLIYDFGAGTVDLSLIRVEWNQEERYPKSWQVKNTLGVPIAGNYLDSILARLIDESLRDNQVLKPDLFSYRFPVVGKYLKKGEEDEHHKAIYNLWMAIRETKQQDNIDIPTWGKNNPFCVNIGNPKQEGMVGESKSGATDKLEELDVSSPPSEQCLRFHEKEGNIYLCIPEKEVHDYPPMREFIEFISETVISELLNGANLNATDVNTVVISGRGALWPGLREKIWDQFPNLSKANKPDDFIKNSKKAKEAVVRGAIAWQQLQWKKIDITLPPVAPLGILLDNNTRLKTEDEWENGIDLTNNETFRLVELALKDPKPQSDFKSLRRYFYILVNETKRDLLWTDNPILIAKSEEQNGTKRVRFENMEHQYIDLMATGSVTQTQDSDSGMQSVPPWPIGEILLPPEKDNG